MAKIEVINDRFTGCMLGAAVGDAFGYPLEGMEYEDMCDRFDHIGAIDLAVSKKSGTALFTDDTQMTLFTADGILWADMMGGKNGDIDYAEYVFYAYQFWLYTQTKTVAGKEYAWLFDQSKMRYKTQLLKRKGLYKKRNPSENNIAALLAARNNNYGTPSNIVNNNSDNGGMKRVAPAGLYFCEDTAIAFRMGCEFAAITHGAPSGYLAGGCYAAIIAEIIRGAEVRTAVERAMDIIIEIKCGEERYNALKKAIELVDNEEVAPLDAVKQLGTGRSAAEALAIGAFCAMLHRDNFRFAIELAANHDGSSDTCASICGAILGAYYGEAALPKNWLKKLQYHDLIQHMGDRLYDASGVMEKFADNEEDEEEEEEE